MLALVLGKLNANKREARLRLGSLLKQCWPKIVAVPAVLNQEFVSALIGTFVQGDEASLEARQN